MRRTSTSTIPVFVKIAAVAAEAGARAREMIEAIVKEPEVGRIYEGPVKNIDHISAPSSRSCPGTEGTLPHLRAFRTVASENTEDVVSTKGESRPRQAALDRREGPSPSFP